MYYTPIFLFKGDGVTLCEDCHKTFHKKYGYKNNTSQQFKEFMGGH